jgi:Phosphotransferase enzyme family
METHHPGLADGLAPLWGPGSVGPTRSFLVLPSVADPRLVLPAGGGRAAATVLHALRDESTVKARARSWALRGASLLHLRTTELPDPPLLAAVTADLAPGTVAADLVYGVHLGPRRANRKPVLAVAGPDGGLLAIVKWGMNPLTDRLVAHEAAALQQLTSLPADCGVQVPGLLGQGDFAGHPYVVQSPVPTSGVGPWSLERAVEAQVAVATSGGQADAADYLARFGAAWQERPTTCDPVDRGAADAFGRLATTWLGHVRRAPLQHGRWHGDWRRTNMALTRNGCSVWDWERFDSGVPLGYDALHLFLTGRAGSPETLAADVFVNAARLLRPFGIESRDDAELVTCGYLLELAGRYLDDGQSTSGARLGAVGQWLLPTLTSVLDGPEHEQGASEQ